jgi:tRNA pseudouridine38-40 synthase
MKERYRVDLSYDGTEFHGSQYQPDLRTVQGEVESSLRQLTWQGDSVLFAGRTDAGVHAAGQVIAFDLDWGHEEKDLQQALNAVFPEDIAARKVDRVEEDFHPRYHAKARHYRYQIRCSPVRHPLLERYSWRVWPEMNLQKLNQAAGPLVGTHDFRAFGSPHQPEGSTIREIRQANWHENADLLVFDLVGNAFLYHMVRHIVITLVEIGQGKEPIRKIEEYLSDPGGPPAPGLAPARGLILQKVIYESQA